MMTEKRFKAYGNNFIAIDDNVENKTYYLNEDVDRIVDLLNSLYDEKRFCEEMAQNLKSENEQLRQTIQKIAEIDDLTVDELLSSIENVSDKKIVEYLKIFESDEV